LPKGKVAIIGAGPGGLTSGMLLASRGFEVDIFEKKPVLGGRNAPLQIGDYKFDTGPTFFMMKFILDQVFLKPIERPKITWNLFTWIPCTGSSSRT